VVVFLPLVSVTGVTGSFFRALAITMTVALLTSLLLAVTWTPALSLVFLRDRRSGSDNKHDQHGRIMRKILLWHEQGLTWALGRPLMLLGLCALLATGSFFCYRGLGSDLLPEMDEGGFILDYIMPAGSSRRLLLRERLTPDILAHFCSWTSVRKGISRKLRMTCQN
jgi:multidrug efflux pump subunit AcrB